MSHYQRVNMIKRSVGLNMIKRSVGRPKTLNRQHVIDIALNEYWSHGINNVPLSKIAILADVSRPGIYIEFGDEDALKAEVLKKYLEMSSDPVHDNYNNYKKYPNHLFNHFDGILNDGNKNLTNDSNYLNIKRPQKAKGCLLQRSILNKHNLGSVTLNIIDKYQTKRLKQFEKYIKSAQADGKFSKNLNPTFYSKFILAQFSLIQTLRLQEINKTEIASIINTALNTMLTKNHRL